MDYVSGFSLPHDQEFLSIKQMSWSIPWIFQVPLNLIGLLKILPKNKWPIKYVFQVLLILKSVICPSYCFFFLPYVSLSLFHTVYLLKKPNRVEVPKICSVLMVHFNTFLSPWPFLHVDGWILRSLEVEACPSDIAIVATQYALFLFSFIF